MEFSPRRGRKPPTPTPPPPAKSFDNNFSTFIINNEGDDDGVVEQLAGDDIDYDSLPPLLKHLPKDFGGAGSFDFDAETSDDISGTFIVKPDHHHGSSNSSGYHYSSSSSMAAPHSVRRSRNPAFSSSRPSEVSPRSIEPNNDVDDDEGDFGTFVVKKGRNEVDDDDDEEEEEEEGEEFGTFVVRKTTKERREKESEEISGTFVRKTSGGGSTMSRAVASMQAVGELGFGGRNKRSGGGSGQSEDVSGQVRQLQSKMSSSSIPECIAREDPSSKYELLHELGEFYAG